MRHFFLIFGTILLIGSCSTPNRDQDSEQQVEVEQETSAGESTKDQLMEEVMALHDAVMPEMGNIRSTQKSLRELAESTTDQAKGSSYLQQADLLDSAFQSMMGWMRQFDPDYVGTEDEVKDYLREQKAMMSEVKDLMESALEDGQRLLEDAE